MTARMVAIARRLRKLWPLWVVLAALLAVVLVLFLPPLLIAPYGLKDAEKRLAAENAMRTTLAGTFGGLAVVAGAIVGALNFRETSRQNRAVLELQRRGQVTERFSKAIEQLGESNPDKLDIRIGAVYALEQIARDSPKTEDATSLYWPIMEVLTAYLREHARWTEASGGTGGSTEPRTPADHQAIATVIGRRRREHDPPNQRLDLHKVDLSGVEWYEAQLTGANLYEAQLAGADLRGAHLEGANLYAAQLEGAYLYAAQMEGANLVEAQLEGADLGRAQLDGAYLSRAQLERANLYAAQLDGANLAGAQLDGANLYAAQLEGANLAGAQLEGANLAGAQLERADLHEAQLRGATLVKAQLEGANLSGAQLERAHLKGANLQGANLDGANLSGADLSDVKNLTWTQLQAARNWDQAKLPAYLVEERAKQAEPGAIAPTEEPRREAGDDELPPRLDQEDRAPGRGTDLGG